MRSKRWPYSLSADEIQIARFKSKFDAEKAMELLIEYENKLHKDSKHKWTKTHYQVKDRTIVINDR
jgi:hypothetical protein